MRFFIQVLAITFMGIPSLSGAEWNSFKVFPPMSQVYHPVSTKSEEAQNLFNEGLLAVYAFNHEEAYALFEKASQIDPNLAMAYWGMALSLGENLNKPIDREGEEKAFALMEKASSLLSFATEKEKKYIEALSIRYSNDELVDKNLLAQTYRQAMKQLSDAYPDDLDAATLYSESIMDLKPWNLWTNEGMPVDEGTLEIVSVLESVLKRNPDHLGANHYYIHAVEASNNPQRALSSAYRLYHLLPDWGHILHMPSHIFFLVGDYEAASKANKEAVEADEAYIKKKGTPYYVIHYLCHNLFFLCRSYLWQERIEEALEAAKKLEAFLTPHLTDMPELEYYMLATLQVHLYAHNWEAILELPKPEDDFMGHLAFWRFARSMALVKSQDLVRAEREKRMFLNIKEKVSPEEYLGFNSAQQILAIASHLLNAAFMKEKKAYLDSIRYLEAAVKEQDQLNYNEPPDWFYQIRQTLGASYLEMKEFVKGESAFRKALDKYPRNGRSLFGLKEALKKQNKDFYSIEREMVSALKYAKKELQISDL